MSVVVFHGDVVFKLENPLHTLKTEAVAELVLELDNRLVPKDEFEHARNNALQVFKKMLFDNVPEVAKKATLYGFRTNQHPSSSKDDLQVQCMLKLPAALRKDLLTFSGVKALLVRDFLERGSAATDTSILPRFWPVSGKDHRELNIVANPVPGKAGLALTRRGLALRVWNDSIGEARKIFLADDDRICATNINVIPRFTYEAAGWPSGLEASDVVASTYTATGVAPIPTRTFRSAGVHTWVLVFQERPKLGKFNVQVNTSIFEILLKEAPMQPTPKGSGKGKAPSKKKEAPLPNPMPAPQLTMFHTDKQRLDKLEEKFETLGKQMHGIEDRQTSMEKKIDARFSDISDSLRQLLHQSTTRPRETVQGESPPAKLPRPA